MYIVYLLESVKNNKWYIGYTPDDVQKRLAKHNAGHVPSTRSYMPWKIIYFESYCEREDATGREKYLKSGSGRKFLHKQLKYYISKNGSPRDERSELYAGQ